MILCIIIAIICGVISGKLYQMNTNQHYSRHNGAKYGRVNKDEDQV